jgi:hypothetical protein
MSTDLQSETSGGPHFSPHEAWGGGRVLTMDVKRHFIEVVEVLTTDRVDGQIYQTRSVISLARPE